MLYAEYGAKHFFHTKAVHLLDCLPLLGIDNSHPIVYKILSFAELRSLAYRGSPYYLIFYCPGSLLGEGKEQFKNLQHISTHQIAVSDHYTNVWQRFTDEIKGDLFLYASSYMIVQSEMCKQRVLDKGYTGQILSIDHFCSRHRVDPPKCAPFIDLLSNRCVIFITEWYSTVNHSIIDFDQECEEFQMALLLEYGRLMSMYPHISFGVRSHPHLRDIGWQPPRSIASQINYFDANNPSLHELMLSNYIFIGIDSNALLQASRAHCMVYSIHSESAKFRLSNYEPRIVEIDSIYAIQFD
jgi:hypothetical protein